VGFPVHVSQDSQEAFVNTVSLANIAFHVASFNFISTQVGLIFSFAPASVEDFGVNMSWNISFAIFVAKKEELDTALCDDWNIILLTFYSKAFLL